MKYLGISTKEDFEFVQKAVARHTPMRPNFWGDGYSDGELVYDMYDCPNCGESYEIDYEKHKFCPECGQALDWSEE